MRILGELIVIFGLATAGMVFAMRRWIGPALRRRQLDELERENRELDERLARIRGHNDDGGGNGS